MKYQSWKIISRYPKDPISEILTNRSIKDRDSFFNPKYESLPKAKDFPGLIKAIKVIKQVKESGQKVGLFMDYDADGICGGAIIYKALEKLQIKVEAYVPKREEGYGLSLPAVDHFKKTDCKLLICVDCGIRNVDEIAYANSLKIKTIIVDHHQLGEVLPKAEAIVHPLIISSNKLSFRDYSGGGVAFVLVSELLEHTGYEKWLLDLATISSVADVVPLKDINRVIIKFGLIVLNKTRNIGLKKMFEKAKITSGKIGTYEVGFMIAPRINAAGRVSDPHKSFELLTSSNEKTVEKAAAELEKLNVDRQNILEQMLIEAMSIVEKQKLFLNKIIVIKKEGFNEGIIGLVASRLVEKYYRPSIVIAQKGKFLKGSARSISGINITDLIGKSELELLSFGGHSQAAGLSLELKNYQKFYKQTQEFANSIDKILFDRVLKIDLLLDLEQFDLNLTKELEKMEPFGLANPRPVLAFEKVTIFSVQNVGKDQNHTRFTVRKGQNEINCIAFRAKENGFVFKNGDIVDIAFNAKINTWNGQDKVELIIEDVKKT